MLPSYQNSTDLLINVTENKLYSKLIAQLNKDFSLANFDFHLSEKSTPLALKEELKKAVKNLILSDFTTYNALLYIVDVSEESIKKINSSDVDVYSEHIVFLILKRIWKKVWFRAKYSS
jgi:predicted secreted protein